MPGGAGAKRRGMSPAAARALWLAALAYAVACWVGLALLALMVFGGRLC